MTFGTDRTGNHRILLPVVLAVCLFVPLFAIRRIGNFDFWWWMSLNAALVITFGFVFDRSYIKVIRDDLRSDLLKKIFLGILSAALLYGVFYAGNSISRILFPFAGAGIHQVYSFKGGASTVRIALLMIFLIGPGEELFWRGLLQRQWMERFGNVPGYLAAGLIYALIHISSGNIMLVLAAGVCGLFWGWLYLRYRSVLLLVISHTLWDLLIFLFFTFEG
ncbi:lysostaphin resistance A-like protein [Acidobacteriota bacterium]